MSYTTSSDLRLSPLISSTLLLIFSEWIFSLFGIDFLFYNLLWLIVAFLSHQNSFVLQIFLLRCALPSQSRWTNAFMPVHTLCFQLFLVPIFWTCFLSNAICTPLHFYRTSLHSRYSHRTSLFSRCYRMFSITTTFPSGCPSFSHFSALFPLMVPFPSSFPRSSLCLTPSAPLPHWLFHPP